MTLVVLFVVIYRLENLYITFKIYLFLFVEIELRFSTFQHFKKEQASQIFVEINCKQNLIVSYILANKLESMSV